MPLDERVRDRILLAGGKLAGVDCPHCDFSGRDIRIEAHSITSVNCPNCGDVILTEAQKAQLRRAGKL